MLRHTINHREGIEMEDVFYGYGYAISDRDGELRDIAEIISELKEIHEGFSTHAMSDEVLFLQGKKKMLAEVIQYLERV